MTELTELPSDAMDIHALREFLEMVGPAGPSLLRSIVESYAVETPPLITALGLAIERGDLSAVARLARRLQGNCLSIGASGLAARCALIEQMCQRGIRPSRTTYTALEGHFAAATAALRAFTASLA